MKRLRVLVLVHPDLLPPDSSKGFTEQQISEWKTEYDVVTTLRSAGHDVKPLGVSDELKPIRDEIETWKPDVVLTFGQDGAMNTHADHTMVSAFTTAAFHWAASANRQTSPAQRSSLLRTSRAILRVSRCRSTAAF